MLGNKLMGRTNFSEALSKKREMMWTEIKKTHPKQFLYFESYTAHPDRIDYACEVKFSCIENGCTVGKTMEFQKSFKPTKKGILKEIEESRLGDKIRNFNTVIINDIVITPVEKSVARLAISISKVTFRYRTLRGNVKSDQRIILLDNKADSEEVAKEFNSYIAAYNAKNPHRAIIDISISEIESYNINNMRGLSLLKDLSNKEKSRILINKTNQKSIIIFEVKSNYTTNREAKKESTFMLPMVTCSVEAKFSDDEIVELIKNNKARKVSNVQILGTKSLYNICI